jgi:Ca-activated chloride channel family protein
MFDQPDNWLDEQLRHVHVPAGLEDRLRQVAVISDDDIDATLADVPLPEGLVERLLNVPEFERHRAARRSLRRRWAALAASVLMLLNAAYFAAVGSSIWLAHSKPLPVVEPTLLASVVDVENGWLDSTVNWLREPIVCIERGAPSTTQSPIPVRLAFDTPSTATADNRMATELRLRQRWIGEEVTQVAMSTDVALAGLGNFLADSRFDDGAPTNLHFRVSRLPQGFDLPLDSLAERFFLMKHGIFPPLESKEHPVTQAPLHASAASFELARNYVQAGELPPPERIRTEEFLAAVDYGFPRPTNRAVDLMMASGPSPLAAATPGQTSGAYLIQAGVQARDLPTAQHRAIQMAIAVDTSASMGQDQRLAMVQRALEAAGDALGPQDRLSLVTFNDHARALVEDLGQDDLASWRSAVASLSPSGGTHLAAGLITALGSVASLPATKGVVRQVVLITDGSAELDPSARERLEQALAKAAAVGVTLQIIDVNSLGVPDKQLAALAKLGRGKVRRIGGADQLRWALVEILSGRSQMVAAGTRLSVTFNPKVVASYRLLGHEPTIFTGLSPARLQTDLYAGQAATALYEVQLLPAIGSMGTTDLEVASMQLDWRDPQGGQARKINQKLMRSQLRGTFAEATPALQLATLAVGTAEILRDSPFATHLSLSDVLDWSRQMTIGVPAAQRASFRELVSLVQKADQLKPRRSQKMPRPR